MNKFEKMVGTLLWKFLNGEKNLHIKFQIIYVLVISLGFRILIFLPGMSEANFSFTSQLEKSADFSYFFEKFFDSAKLFLFSS